MLRIKLLGYTVTVKKDTERVRKDDFIPRINEHDRKAKVSELLTDDFIAHARQLQAVHKG